MEQKSLVVIAAHTGDFVWRCAGAIALHTRLGYRAVIICLSYGERGEAAKLDRVTAFRFALQARMSAQAVGRSGGKAIGSPEIHGMTIGAPQVYCFEPHQSELCGFKPDTLLDISEVWDKKWQAIECIKRQPLMWEHYKNVAIQRGAVARGRPAYAEAYQRLFPATVRQLD